MLIIDKVKVETRFILTLTELTTVDNPVYTLSIYSPFTKKEFDFTLSGNTSTHQFRYDEFVIQNTEFDDLETGLYQYTVSEATDGVIQQGMLKVIDAVNDNVEYISITTTPSEDDYVIYNQ